MHILDNFGLDLNNKNNLSSSTSVFDEGLPESVSSLTHIYCISVCNFQVGVLFSCIFTLSLLSYHWQEKGLSCFLTSHPKLGVSLQFPLLKKELSMLPPYISHMQHAIYMSDRMRDLHSWRIEFTDLSSSSSGPREGRLRLRNCQVDWIRCHDD